MVKTYAQTINLVNDQEKIAEYIEHHKAIYPEVKEGLEKIGIRSMRIFHIGTQLFMLMETEDGYNPKEDYLTYLAHSPRCQEWETLMGTFQSVHPEAKEGEKWALMDEVFTL